MKPSPKNASNNVSRTASITNTMPAFQKHQYAFTATIRNPEQYRTPEGIEERRMNIYRELVYNNIDDLLANFFPVMKQITAGERWRNLVRGFVANHKSRTPIFMKLAGEFVEYLQTGFTPYPDDPEFLVELAHYEWVEIALNVASEEPDWPLINREGDLLSEPPYLSPLIWPLYYQYPVHRISPGHFPAAPQPTHLLVYRDTSDEVRFMDMNAATAHLLNAIKNNAQGETKANGMQLLQQLADEMQHPNPEVVIAGGLQTLQEWHKRHILLGTYK